MKDILKMKRLSLLITREFALNKKNVFIMISSMTFVSMLVTYLLPHHFQIDQSIFRKYQMYPWLVGLYCTIVFAYSFLELNYSDRNIEFVMLPSSTLEKYLTKFIYSTFGYILMAAFALAMTSIFVSILNAGNPAGFRDGISYFDRQNLIMLLQVYLLFHSIFFFGGVYFRKLELVKTFLAAVGLIVLFYLLQLILQEVLGFYKVSPSFSVPRINETIRNDSNQFITFASREKLNELIWNVRQIAKIVGLNILPVFFWIMSYLRLKENEVADGV